MWALQEALAGSAAASAPAAATLLQFKLLCIQVETTCLLRADSTCQQHGSRRHLAGAAGGAGGVSDRLARLGDPSVGGLDVAVILLNPSGGLE